MKYFFFVVFALNFSASFAQESGDSILFSGDGKYLIMYKDTYNYSLDYNQITVRNFDSLNVGTTYILKDDTIFTKNPSYAGQYGYYFYVGNIKTYNVIYDTLLLNDFYLKFGFNNNNWIHPVPFQLDVDTLGIILDEPRNSSNYFIFSNDTIDMSKSYEFLVKLIYKENILYSRKESADVPYIFNTFRLRDTGLFIDSIQQTYFLTGYIEFKNFLNDHETYELKTTLIAYEIFEGGIIPW